MVVPLSLRPYLKTVAIVLAATALAGAVVWFTPLDSVSAVYMLPVLISGVRYGTGPAILAALLGAVMTSLFYPPLFSVLVFEPAQMIDLATSLVVALTVGPLAGRLRAQMLRATQGERAIRQVYGLSSAIAATPDVEAVYDIVAEHMAEALGRPVALFVPGERGGLRTARSALASDVAGPLTQAVDGFLGQSGGPATAPVAVPGLGPWLVCRLASGQDRPAALAVRLDAEPGPFEDVAAQAQALLTESTRSLERLGLSQVLADRKLRQRTDALRDILVESVSHELRTPLAGIMGSASVLAASPALDGHPSLLALAGGIEQEAGRLDRLIQNVLDLGRIRAGALQPRLDTADPLDIVNNALDLAAARLGRHAVHRELDTELPLVSVDPVLVAQALINVLENAAKYTPPGGTIAVAATREGEAVALSVRDEGAGLAHGEADLIFERFHRGERHADIAGGSGLGLTIARVFVEACGGRIAASSQGAGLGTTMKMVLPLAETGRRNLDDE